MNVGTLLTEVAPDAPSGANLEYDRAFIELEQLSQGKPERQMGTSVVEAEEPDWRAVEKQASELLTRTKDLRVVAHLVRALLKSAGLPGLAQGLSLLRGLVERYWASLHPQLDPDDDNDPTMRINVLMSLCDASVVAAVRAAPLVSSRLLGRFGLREVDLASGASPAAPGSTPVDPAAIDGAFAEVEVATLQATADAARSGLTDLAFIETFVNEQVGAHRGPNLAPLSRLLKQASDVLTERLIQRGVAGPSNGEGAGDTTNGAPAAAGRRSSLTGEINSRDDVIRALDKIIEYYQRAEPSSPIPLLLQRSKRLVAMSFMDIVRDLAPEGVAQVENLRGRDESG
jgi:type VI secretion system protein ImpA